MKRDLAAAEAAIDQFLRALGFEPEKQSELAGTPARVVEAFDAELLRGYGMDVEALVRAGALPANPENAGQIVAVTQIAVATTCPHHLMPALGTADVVYLPGPSLLGLGTLTSIVEAYSRRLSLQEEICAQVAQALVRFADARGALCRLSLVHSCLSARGSKQSNARVTTIHRAGELADIDAETLLSVLTPAGNSTCP